MTPEDLRRLIDAGETLAVAFKGEDGFEPPQHEQMVLQYVAKHGRITRCEAAEPCQVWPLQGRAPLSRLSAGAKLARRRSGRGAFYDELPLLTMEESKIGYGQIHKFVQTVQTEEELMIPKGCKRLAEVHFPIAEASKHPVRGQTGGPG